MSRNALFDRPFAEKIPCGQTDLNFTTSCRSCDPPPPAYALRRFFQLPESEAADLFRYGTAGAVSLCADSNVAEDDEGSAGIVCDRRGSVLVKMRHRVRLRPPPSRYRFAISSSPSSWR